MTRWKKFSHENSNQKITEVAIIISDKGDVKSKTAVRKKEQYILIKDLVH